MIEIKETALEGLMLTTYHPILLDVLLWMRRKDIKVTITSGYRPGDPRTHGTIPCRSVDLRSWSFPRPEEIEEMINQYWVYDPSRKEKQVALFHDSGGGKHIHLQVHDLTRRRKNENGNSGSFIDSG